MEKEAGALGSDDVSERIRIAQLDMLSRLTQVMALCGINSMLFLYWVFSKNGLAIGWVAPLCILPLVYAAVLGVGHAWQRTSRSANAAEASMRFVRRYVVLVLMLTVLWATMLFGLNAVADNDQRSVLYATTIGVISTGAMFLPLSVAVTFLVPVTLGACLMLGENGRFIDLQIFGLLLGYSPLILFTALFFNRTLVRRVKHEARLQDQADVIGLLLRDFEANNSHWLWETDSEMRFKNVAPRVADIA